MDHQLAPGVVRTPAARLPRAKIFQQHQLPQRQSPPQTPRAGLALLSNRNENAAVSKATNLAAPAAVVKPPAPAVEPAEQAPPPPTAYEAPFEWEFLPDTADWLRLLGRLSGRGPGAGLPFRGRLATYDAADYDNKENVPPPPPSSASPSPPSSPGGHHWEESPTRRICNRRRHRHRAGDIGDSDSSDDDACCEDFDADEDRVAICFDIDRIL